MINSFVKKTQIPRSNAEWSDVFNGQYVENVEKWFLYVSTGSYEK